MNYQLLHVCKLHTLNIIPNNNGILEQIHPIIKEENRYYWFPCYCI